MESAVEYNREWKVESGEWKESGKWRVENGE